MADLDYTTRGLKVNRDSLHRSEGYQRQVDALKQLPNRRTSMADLDTLKPEVWEALTDLYAHSQLMPELQRAEETLRAELLRLAAENARLLATVKFRSEAAEAAHGNWQVEFERAERAESELAALKQRVDGYVVTFADKSHPSGLRYVMAYNERETADVLLKNDRHNNGLAVRAFRLLDDGEGA